MEAKTKYDIIRGTVCAKWKNIRYWLKKHHAYSLPYIGVTGSIF